MTDDLVSEEELTEIAALAESATPGPWHVRSLDDDHAMNLIVVSTSPDDDTVKRFPRFDHSEMIAAMLVQHPRYVEVVDGRWDENARFIAASRNLVPRLVAEIRRHRGISTSDSE